MAFAEARIRPRRAPPNAAADVSQWFSDDFLVPDENLDIDMFLGRLVRICGVDCDLMESRADWLASGLSTLEGVKGKAVHKEDEEYFVLTFNRMVLKIPEANLQILDLEVPEQGGFDVAYPAALAIGDDGLLQVVKESGIASSAFAHACVLNMMSKGYCMIQMFDSDERQSEMTRLADATTDYVGPKAEFVEALLGSGPLAKVMSLSPARGDDAWSSYDARFDELIHLLLDQGELNFNASDARLASLLRRSFEGPWEEEWLAPTPISQADIEAGLVEQHLDFVQRRKICCMYFVSGDGGSIDLYPRTEGSSFSPTTLPTENGRLLIFRHDMLNFRYLPSGEDLVLQTWLGEEPPGIELEEIKAGSEVEVAKFMGVEQGPEDTYQTHLISWSVSWGWSVNSGSEMWASFAAGIDSQLLVPTVRCEEEHTEYMLRHAAWCEDTRLTVFDQSFFGMDNGDKDSTDHVHRMNLECSYACFHNAGYTRESLRNQLIANYCGELRIHKWNPQFSDELYKMCSRDNAVDYWRDTSMLISYMFGLKGPTTSIDTACSTTLVAMSGASDFCRRSLIQNGKPSVGLAGGGNFMYLRCRPAHELVNSSMMSNKGRSFTFDQYADGYARGEGSSWGLVAGSNDQKDIADRLTAVIGVTIGQDGKSASLTAPSGTAQQECIRVNLRTARIAPEEVGYTECHGTGTALGDPVETGALLHVFKRRQRSQFTGTAKTNFGHLEISAGLVGLFALTNMTLNATWKPHNHVRQLNGNCDTTGYPCYIATENCDPGAERLYAGVSSFGFGGTNSRADVWGYARAGHRKVGKRLELEKLDYISVPCPRCLGPMCWLCGVAVSQFRSRRDHRCEAIRAEAASYEYCSNCYAGEYCHAEVLTESEDTGEQVYILGTWTAGTQFEPMERTGKGTHKFYVTLDETLWAQFRLSLKKDRRKEIYPVVDKADKSARILGPDAESEGNSWLIDGRSEKVQSGAVYQVEFRWGELDQPRAISWELVHSPMASDGPNRSSSRYLLVGTFNGWDQGIEMQAQTHTSVYRCTFAIGALYSEDFQIVDADHPDDRVLYPRTPYALPGEEFVCGPGKTDRKFCWQITGRPGQRVEIILDLKAEDHRKKVTSQLLM